MTDKVRIRAAKPSDNEQIYSLWHASVSATHGFLSPADFAEVARMVRDHYLPGARPWVAVAARDRPIGFLDMTGAHIEALFVDPDWHGRGIGRMLVDYAAASHPVLTVDVNEQNESGRRFYERMGFVAFDRSDKDSDGRPYPLIHMRRG